MKVLNFDEFLIEKENYDEYVDLSEALELVTEVADEVESIYLEYFETVSEINENLELMDDSEVERYTESLKFLLEEMDEDEDEDDDEDDEDEDDEDEKDYKESFEYIAEASMKRKGKYYAEKGKRAAGEGLSKAKGTAGKAANKMKGVAKKGLSKAKGAAGTKGGKIALAAAGAAAAGAAAAKLAQMAKKKRRIKQLIADEPDPAKKAKLKADLKKLSNKELKAKEQAQKAKG